MVFCLTSRSGLSLIYLCLLSSSANNWTIKQLIQLYKSLQMAERQNVRLTFGYLGK